MPHTQFRARRIGVLSLASLVGVSATLAQPTPPVRVIAEWEPAIGTLVRYPFAIPQQLVVELARDDKLFVLVVNQSAQNQAQATLNSWGVDPNQTAFIQAPVETQWTRDWGPHQIFNGNGQWAIIDPIFRGYPWVDVTCGTAINSPGGHLGDDAVNTYVANYFGAPLHALPAYLTGGNFLVDGHQAAFSTCTMVDENLQLMTEAQFLALAAQYCGIANYHMMGNTENNGIQHIDCWMKPLDEETLLVKRPPTWHEEYTRIETNLQLLAAVQNCYGRPYRIIRIDCPPYSGSKIAAYTNSLILNKKVFVPLFNIAGDAQAMQTWQAAMPGYQIIGIPWTGWAYYDALHCRTRAIFDRHMLRITHRRLDPEVPPAASFPITAFIDDRSETGLIADELRVYWRAAGAADWSWLHLTPTGEPDTYQAAIPGQPGGTTVEYYIAAADNSGRHETLPRTAPAGYYSFTVVETGLTIGVPNPPELLAPWTATTFEVTINPGAEAVVPGSELLHYKYHTVFLTVPLAHVSGTQYQATLPRAICEANPEFYVSAEGTVSGVKTAPPGAPGNVFTAVVGELQPVTLFSERFESGLPTSWTATGLWHVTTACPINPPCDGVRWAYYGKDSGCNYNTGAKNSGTLSSPPIALPALPPGGAVTLLYCANFETEDEPGYDVAVVYANDAVVDVAEQAAAWQQRAADLTALAGQSVTLKWFFDTVDQYYNNFHGWQVDQVIVTADELDCELVPPYPLGDLNCDGVLDFADINPFVLALSGEADYVAAYPDCIWLNADCNEDGQVDFADINAFVALLTGDGAG